MPRGFESHPLRQGEPKQEHADLSKAFWDKKGGSFAAVSPHPLVLLTTEGTYPLVPGGVTSWAQELLERLSARFIVFALWGPRRIPKIPPLPRNVEEVVVVQLFLQENPPLTMVRQPLLLEKLELFFGFLEGDLASFGEGLYGLAKAAGKTSSPSSVFLSKEADEILQRRFASILGRTPVLAERLLILGQLRGMLANLLRVPPAADIAHTTVNGLGAIPAWLASRHYQIPLVLTEHGVYLRERYFALFALNLPPALSLFFSLFFKTLARLMYQEASLCTSVSEFNRYWQVELGARPEKTLVIPNGIDPARFPPAPQRLEDPPTAVWVGRIDPLKDLLTLVQAFAVARRNLPHARLRLFGPVPQGNEAYVREVSKKIGELGLEKTVTLEGPISPVYRAYHAGWVTVLSSVSEGFPYVVLESLAVGRPVVGTRTGAVSEVIADSGRVVPPSNPEALGEALAELLSDPELCLELGALGRERVIRKYTLENMVASYQKVYDMLIRGVRTASAGEPT